MCRWARFGRGDILKDWRRMSEICRCVNAVRVLPCPVEVTDVEAGVTIGYGAEVVQSWSGVIEGGKEDLTPMVLVWTPVD